MKFTLLTLFTGKSRFEHAMSDRDQKRWAREKTITYRRGPKDSGHRIDLGNELVRRMRVLDI